MSYKINFLNENSIFQEIIDQELSVIQDQYLKKISKLDSLIKRVNINLNDQQGLQIAILTKDDRNLNLEIPNFHKVSLAKEEIEVYFPEEKTRQLKIEEDLSHEFLELKEPLLFIQLKILALLKDDSLYNQIENVVMENLKKP